MAIRFLLFFRLFFAATFNASPRGQDPIRFRIFRIFRIQGYRKETQKRRDEQQKSSAFWRSIDGVVDGRRGSEGGEGEE